MSAQNNLAGPGSATMVAPADALHCRAVGTVLAYIFGVACLALGNL